MWHNKVIVERRGLVFDDAVINAVISGSVPHVNVWYTYYCLINRNNYGSAAALWPNPSEPFGREVRSIALEEREHLAHTFSATHWNMYKILKKKKEVRLTESVAVTGAILARKLLSDGYLVLNERGNLSTYYRKNFAATAVADDQFIDIALDGFACLSRSGDRYLYDSRTGLFRTENHDAPRPIVIIPPYDHPAYKAYAANGFVLDYRYQGGGTIYEWIVSDVIILFVTRPYDKIEITIAGKCIQDQSAPPPPVIRGWYYTANAETPYLLHTNGTITKEKNVVYASPKMIQTVESEYRVAIAIITDLINNVK